ncbi:MAG: T9SS type A sorting domain-containing protein [Bacteroidia bacterium]|nr:T9SS type A sorting domain-containing protein [Bacteroidia bacterium]
MKRKLYISFTLLIACSFANAQNLLYDMLVGDTAIITVTGANGAIQWQESTDSLIWTDILYATFNTVTLITTASGTGMRFFRAEITDSLCPNATLFYSSIIRYKIITNTNQVQVGEWFHGGIVFNTETNGYGLISPPCDQHVFTRWDCYSDNILLGASSTTDGAANTAAIVSGCASTDLRAAKMCDTLALYNFNDWYLPAIDQLHWLITNQDIVGGFSSNSWWSSTEYDAGNAWAHSIGSGSIPSVPFYGPKIGEIHIRCIRTYSPSENSGHLFSIATVTNQPVTVTINTNPENQIKCFGGSVSFSVTADGTAPYSYQWKKDGGIIPGANESIYTANNIALSDEGLYICEVSNLCRSITSDTAELRVIDIIADAGLDARICNGGDTSLLATGSSNYPAESGTLSYNWSPATGLNNPSVANPVANPVITTNYILTVSDLLGCTGTDSLLVTVGNPYPNQRLCYVTVDTITWKNRIIWEKAANVSTAGFIIYKEIGTEDYDSMAYVAFNSPSYFIDLTSNPESKAEKYKIAVIDTCGRKSELSYYHKTMKLAVAAYSTTMQLLWTGYEDESGIFVPDCYIIYRGSAPDNLDSIDFVSAEDVTIYTDENIFDTYYYLIGVRKAGGCTSGKESDVIYSFSNYKKNTAEGIKQINSANEINIFPNPFHDKTTVEIINRGGNNIIKRIAITDITGKVVRCLENIDNTMVEIDRGNLEKGLYILEIFTNKVYRSIFVIQ